MAKFYFDVQHSYGQRTCLLPLMMAWVRIFEMVGGGPGHFGQSYTKYYPTYGLSLFLVLFLAQRFTLSCTLSFPSALKPTF